MLSWFRFSYQLRDKSKNLVRNKTQSADNTSDFDLQSKKSPKPEDFQSNLTVKFTVFCIKKSHQSCCQLFYFFSYCELTNSALFKNLCGLLAKHINLTSCLPPCPEGNINKVQVLHCIRFGGGGGNHTYSQDYKEGEGDSNIRQ